jgi:hypothetical protein
MAVTYYLPDSIEDRRAFIDAAKRINFKVASRLKTERLGKKKKRPVLSREAVSCRKGYSLGKKKELKAGIWNLLRQNRSTCIQRLLREVNIYRTRNMMSMDSVPG